MACSRSSTGNGGAASERDVARLVTVAGDDSAAPAERLRAVAGLGRLGVRAAQARPMLEELLDHPDPELAGQAKIALRQVDGNGSLDFSRCAVLGASVSAGFMGTPVGTVLERSIAGDHRVTALATVAFFRAPAATGRAHVAAAMEFRATVVFAVDFLFWYAYVGGADLDHRVARLDEGLRQLERIEVPLVVGDIPDMRQAATWMLPPEVVPPREQLEALNRHLHAWARSRMNVHVVPLSRWAEPLLTGEDVVEEGKTLRAADLLGLDRLHLSPAGVRYLMRRIDAELERAFPQTAAAALRIAD